MKHLTLLILLCLLLPLSVFSKSALDYYHGGMAQYIEGRKQQAQIEIEEGLRKFPNSQELAGAKKLLDQLNDQEDNKQEQQNQDNQSGDDEQNQDQEQKEEDQGKQDPQDEQNPQDSTEKEQDKPEPQDSTGNQPQDANEDPSDEENPEDENAQDQAAEPVPMGEMSKEDAKRLLDSYKNDEKEDLKNMKKQKGRRGRPTQDW